MGEIVDTAGQPFRQAAKDRERAERDDQGRDAPARDQNAVQAARQCAQAKRRRRGHADRQPAVAPEFAKDDRRETHQRTDRQVDAPGRDHRSQGHRQEADLDAQTEHFERVGQREKIGADDREDRDLEHH